MLVNSFMLETENCLLRHFLKPVLARKGLSAPCLAVAAVAAIITSNKQPDYIS